MKMRLVLPYGLIAEVLLEDADRSAVVAPDDHADDCPCEACVILRDAEGEAQRVLLHP